MKTHLFVITFFLLFFAKNTTVAQNPPPLPPPPPPPTVDWIWWKMMQQQRKSLEKPTRDTSDVVDYSPLVNSILEKIDVPPYLKECGDNQAFDSRQKVNCSYNVIMQFMSKNLTYPRKAVKKNTEGKVIISFVVDTTGHLSQYNIKRDIGNGCGEEALRVVKLFGEQYTWIPAENKGKKVKVLYNLPIQFQLK